MVSVTDYTQFVMDYDNGAFPHERFGQAFLNKFHDHAGVAAHRTDTVLWEGLKSDVIVRLYELKLIG